MGPLFKIMYCTHKINTHFTMFWGYFVRVCFGPQNSNIHPCDQSFFQ